MRPKVKERICPARSFANSLVQQDVLTVSQRLHGPMQR